MKKTLYISFLSLLLSAPAAWAQYQGGSGDGYASTSTAASNSIGENTEPRVQLFPNPAHLSDVVNIQGLKTQQQVQLLDATGRVVQDWHRPKEKLNIQHLQPGSYHLRISGKNHPQVLSLILLKN